MPQRFGESEIFKQLWLWGPYIGEYRGEESRPPVDGGSEEGGKEKWCGEKELKTKAGMSGQL